MSDNLDFHLTDRIELRRLAKLCYEDQEFSKFIPRLWALDVASRKLDAGLSTHAYRGKEGAKEDEWEYIEHDGDPDIASNPTGWEMRADILFELWAKNGALALVDFHGATYAPSQDASIGDIAGYVLKRDFKAFCDLRRLPKPKFWFLAGAAAIVEPRAHNKRNTEARNLSWQAQIDDLAMKHQGTSHAELCRKLAKKVGATFQTIRRNTKLRHG